jgi:Na+/melibiose symporter-like transporter
MVSSLLDRFRRRYGASPLHLAGHLVVFAIALFALDRIASTGSVMKLIALYVGFIVAHDLIFVPAYSALDRATRAALARLPARAPGAVTRINHIRVPAFISGVLLIIYLPLISGKAANGYLLSSGHPLEGFLRNWLLISLALFLGSGLIYVVRVRRAVAKDRP